MDVLTFTKSMHSTSLDKFFFFLTTHYLQVFTCPDDSFQKFCNLWELQMDKDDGIYYIF